MEVINLSNPFEYFMHPRLQTKILSIYHMCFHIMNMNFMECLKLMVIQLPMGITIGEGS